MLVGRTRNLFRRIHLCLAVVFGVFFILMGLTGSIIAWMDELDRALNPELLIASASAATVPARLDNPQLIQQVSERLQADPRYGRPNSLKVPQAPDEVFVASYRVKEAGAMVTDMSSNKDAKATGVFTSASVVLDDPQQKTEHKHHHHAQAGASAMASDMSAAKDQKGGKKGAERMGMSVQRLVYIDPYTLAIKGEREWGRNGLSRTTIIPTIFFLHHFLLAGATGKIITGIVAIALFTVSLVGLLLWLPRMRWRAIRQAWRISYQGSLGRLSVSSHRFFGFFVAPVLMFMAFSGMYFNVPQWVMPIIQSTMTVTQPTRMGSAPMASSSQSAAPDAMSVEPQSLSAIVSAAESRFPAAPVTRIQLPRKANDPYELRLHQAVEAGEGGGTRVTVDSLSGQVIKVVNPMQAASGDVFLSWLFPLHSGEAFGVLGKVFISIVGLMPLAFAVTGTVMWLRKRRNCLQQAPVTAGTSA